MHWDPRRTTCIDPKTGIVHWVEIARDFPLDGGRHVTAYFVACTVDGTGDWPIGWSTDTVTCLKCCAMGGRQR